MIIFYAYRVVVTVYFFHLPHFYDINTHVFLGYWVYGLKEKTKEYTNQNIS